MTLLLSITTGFSEPEAVCCVQSVASEPAAAALPACTSSAALADVLLS